MLHDLNFYVVGRLLLAVILGGMVGLERELSHKPAGIRTNMLIALGAALFTAISNEMAKFGGDHTRIASQIIPGIGFIGAGVVLKEKGTVLGVTSAATIFVVASVGMACGAEMPVTATFVALLLLGTLVVVGQLEDRLGLHTKLINFRVTTADGPGMITQLHEAIGEVGVQTRSWDSKKTEEGLVVEFDAEVTLPQERALLAKFGSVHAHCESHPVG